MALKIRLARGGSKKNPHYFVVVIPSDKARDGKFIEKVGHYHPCLESLDKRIVLSAERLSYWLSKGAQPTDVVVKLMKKNGISVPTKYDIQYDVNQQNQGVSKKERKKRLEEAKKAAAEAKKAKDAAKKAEEQAKKAAAEAA